MRREGLHTVCQEAGCPNIFECWEDREATFLIGGEQCTRRCDFCQIDTGKPEPLDRDEPRRVAESVQAMGLRYATITGVARDDLADGGAWLYAETIRQVHALNPGTGVEILVPDFNAVPEPRRSGARDGARGVRAQRRDGAAHLQAHPPGLPLRALARRHHPGPRRRPGHQVEPHPGHGRDDRRGRRGDARPARGRLRPADDHAVPAPLEAAPPRRALGEARGVRRACPTRPSAWASPASWPGRWCARRTARVGSTCRPCSVAAGRCRRRLAHLAEAAQSPPARRPPACSAADRWSADRRSGRRIVDRGTLRHRRPEEAALRRAAPDHDPVQAEPPGSTRRSPGGCSGRSWSCWPCSRCSGRSSTTRST
nr:hypothetical protein [Angustibacter aerolatus]